MKRLWMFFALAMIALTSMVALAQDMPPSDFLGQVLAAWKSLVGNAGWQLKVAAVIAVLISSMKVTFLRKLIWDKLGSLKMWLGPVLGLVAGLLELLITGHGDIGAIFAYMAAGMGAPYVHELLSLLKKIPGIGPMWVELIEVIESSLGGGKSPEPGK